MQKHNLVSLTLTGLFVLMAQAPVAKGDDPTPNPGRAITLQETLEKGLRVRVDAEKSFVARVVALVEAEAFEEDLVRAVFNKARAKPTKFPFVYFRHMMLVIAEREGVALE